MQRSLPATAVVALLCGVAAMRSPALACPFNDPDHCQAFDDSLNYVVSDRDLGRYGYGQRAADDFVPTEDTLTTVCVWGLYIDQDPQAAHRDCGPAAVDHFRVQVYSDDPWDEGNPYSFKGGSAATSERTVLPSSQIESTTGIEVYAFSLSLDAPIIGLKPGVVYWLEVSNNVDDVTSPTCHWYWSRRAQSSSSYSFIAQDRYSLGREVPFDNAFCTNFTLEQSPLGTRTRACCPCGGTCSLQALADCTAMNGVWHIDEATCEGIVCGAVPPNDDCASGPSLVTDGEYVFPHECATTDGYGPIEADTGLSQIERDVWYSFIAPSICQLTVSTCNTGTRPDSMLAIYHNPDDPTTCPPCPLLDDPDGAQISAATLAGQGKDESCLDGSWWAGGGLWIGTWELGRAALPGECFLIRVGGYPGGREGASGVLSVTCRDAASPFLPEPDPTGVRKNRFISFQMPPQTVGPTAIRVILTSLHHVVPPFCTGGPSIPFTSFEGQHRWVGPPVEYLESAASGIHFYAATLQCEPYYHDWSTVGLLHVTGSAIVPSSTYHVEHVSAACEGVEDSPPCQSGGANVSARLPVYTPLWGDVETPFNPPSTAFQPDMADISALVNKFKSAPGAPIKAQALLAGTDAFGNVDISPDLGFQHISACVDAFKCSPYPYKPAECP